MKLQLQLLLFGLLAAAGNLLGGWLITSYSGAIRRNVRNLLALGAGFMLAAVFLEVLPEIATHWGAAAPTAMVWLLGGYLLLHVVEHAVIPHFHFGEETHPEAMIHPQAAYTSISALAIHTFFDGVAIASGLVTNLRLGIVLFLAVLLHKIPEGFTAASIVLSSGLSQSAARRATILIAASTLLGMVLVSLARPAVTYTLPLSSGVTLYVAASDLIPEVNREGGWRISLVLFLGVALFYLVHLLLHSALEH
jgi:zinc transporter ZupT